MKVTRDIALRVALHGACFIPEVGKDISSFSTSHLTWVENMKIFTQKETNSNMPLWTRSGSGYGSGYGSGSGDGYGYGSGDGSKDFQSLLESA